MLLYIVGHVPTLMIAGAGKTETTKKAMQYFALLAGGTGIEDQVLEVGRREGLRARGGECLGAATLAS